MQVVTKDSNYNIVLKLRLSLDRQKSEYTDSLVDVYVNNINAISGYKVTTEQSNVRPWPEQLAQDRSEEVLVYLNVPTQEIVIPDQIVDGKQYTNVIQTTVADSVYPLKLKIVPTQPGHNVLVSGVSVGEIPSLTALEDGAPYNVKSEDMFGCYNPVGVPHFFWVTIENPTAWEYDVVKDIS